MRLVLTFLALFIGMGVLTIIMAGFCTWAEDLEEEERRLEMKRRGRRR